MTVDTALLPGTNVKADLNLGQRGAHGREDDCSPLAANDHRGGSASVNDSH